MMKTIAAVLLLLCGLAAAQTTPKKPQPYTVEYYYKVKWGHQSEFLELFQKNHFPILQENLKKGEMLSVTAVEPSYHATESARWDFRVTIVFRDVEAATDSSGDEEIVKRLYPDQATFKKEEQRRFEILDAHWDVPIKALDLSKK